MLEKLSRRLSYSLTVCTFLAQMFNPNFNLLHIDMKTFWYRRLNLWSFIFKPCFMWWDASTGWGEILLYTLYDAAPSRTCQYVLHMAIMAKQVHSSKSAGSVFKSFIGQTLLLVVALTGLRSSLTILLHRPQKLDWCKPFMKHLDYEG